MTVEILSANSRWFEVEEKVADYLGSGARVVWLVDSRERRMVVRYPDRPGTIVAPDGEDVVPGFKLTLAELFGL